MTQISTKSVGFLGESNIKVSDGKDKPSAFEKIPPANPTGEFSSIKASRQNNLSGESSPGI